MWYYQPYPPLCNDKSLIEACTQLVLMCWAWWMTKEHKRCSNIMIFSFISQYLYMSWLKLRKERLSGTSRDMFCFCTHRYSLKVMPMYDVEYFFKNLSSSMWSHISQFHTSLHLKPQQVDFCCLVWILGPL